MLLSQTGLLRFAQFFHSLLCIGALHNKHLISRLLLEIGLHLRLTLPRLLKRRKLNVKADTRTQPGD